MKLRQKISIKKSLMKLRQKIPNGAQNGLDGTQYSQNLVSNRGWIFYKLARIKVKHAPKARNRQQASDKINNGEG